MEVEVRSCPAGVLQACCHQGAVLHPCEPTQTSDHQPQTKTKENGERVENMKAASIRSTLLHSLAARLFSRSEGTWTQQRQRTRKQRERERERELEKPSPETTALLLFCWPTFGFPKKLPSAPLCARRPLWSGFRLLVCFALRRAQRALGLSSVERRRRVVEVVVWFWV